MALYFPFAYILPPAELKAMQIVWERATATAGEVRAALLPARQPVLERATDTYLKLLGLLLVATLLAAVFVGPGVLTTIGAALLILGGLWLALLCWAVWGERRVAWGAVFADRRCNLRAYTTYKSVT